MKRVTGIGGVFFKAKDPKALRAVVKRCSGSAGHASAQRMIP